MSHHTLALEWIPGLYAVCRLPGDADVPTWAGAAGAAGTDGGRLLSVTRTDRELSIVAPEEIVPTGATAEGGWVALRVVGTLEFSMVGVLARLTGVLAIGKVSVFAISTYDTDILLVKATDSETAIAALGSLFDVSRL